MKRYATTWNHLLNCIDRDPIYKEHLQQLREHARGPLILRHYSVATLYCESQVTQNFLKQDRAEEVARAWLKYPPTFSKNHELAAGWNVQSVLRSLYTQHCKIDKLQLMRNLMKSLIFHNFSLQERGLESIRVSCVPSIQKEQCLDGSLAVHYGYEEEFSFEDSEYSAQLLKSMLEFADEGVVDQLRCTHRCILD